MQAKMQILVRRNGRIFMALCVILFMGCTVQAKSPVSSEVGLLLRSTKSTLIAQPEFAGVPVQIGQYAWVRCRPGAHSANCIEERGIRFMIPEGHANMILPPMADPTLMKKFQEHPDTFLVSEDEYGSGNEIEPEYGSGIESDMDASIISDQIQPDPNLKLKLKNEALFLKDNRL